ncbi:MAG: phospholipase D-like domain-containing protein [Gemmatimonadaceae bacterium]
MIEASRVGGALRGSGSEPSLLEQAFTRAAGTPLITGNAVRLLRNAEENYPAWLDAIAAARETIHFETYIIWDDDQGALFAEALAAKAREGVRVRLIYDWLGAMGKTPRGFWDSMVRAGAEVRCFNPPRFSSPLGWLHRDHRKGLVADSHVAFVSGLCVGQQWIGDPEHETEPWRDTGVELRGPAVDTVERAFARAWAVAGAREGVDEEALVLPAASPAGDIAVRVVASEPWSARMMRLEQLMAGAAQERLWLTDAYFTGTPDYVQALRAAARDGVDVRLLVPGTTDIPLLQAFSRSGYRSLLEAGVRVYEWRGAMLHAKTALVDAQWSRVGSSNLNMASWIGNWELDVAVDDNGFTESMAAMYLDDLGNSTEIILANRRIVDRRSTVQPQPLARRAVGSTGRIAAGAVRLGNTASAIITEHRVLGPAEARVAAMLGGACVLLAIVALLWPAVVAIPLGLLVAWIGGAMITKAHALRKKRAEAGTSPLHVVEAGSDGA